MERQIVKFANSGSRVEIATLSAVSTMVSMKANSRPGTTCIISWKQSCHGGVAVVFSLASKIGL